MYSRVGSPDYGQMFERSARLALLLGFVSNQNSLVYICELVIEPILGGGPKYQGVRKGALLRIFKL